MVLRCHGIRFTLIKCKPLEYFREILINVVGHWVVRLSSASLTKTNNLKRNQLRF